MPIDPSDVAARLAACTPADECRGMFFTGVLNAVRAVCGEDEAAACAAVLPKGRRIDFLMYPATDYLKVITRGAQALEPKLGLDGALRRLGRQSLDDFFGSAVGKTFLALVGKNPRLLMEKTPSAYRVSVTWGERRVEFPGPKHARLYFDRELIYAQYQAGVLEAGMQFLGGGMVVVAVTEKAPMSCVYDVTWE